MKRKEKRSSEDLIFTMDETFEAIVVGAGHAGCEAALALARKGHRTLMLSVSLDNIAFMACNPSIGGTAKGHLVRELDALGGEMGVNADKTLLQLRMLNLGKGAAVHSLRAQSDKNRYHIEMKRTLERTPNLEMRQAEVVEILTESEEGRRRVTGVKTAYGEKLFAPVVVLCCGVYLKAEVITGEYRRKSGPSGFAPANLLSENLAELGFEIRRFKTGTPARVLKSSIDFSRMEVQNGGEGLYAFSFLTDEPTTKGVPCYLTYTTSETKKIILENLDRAPMYSGGIKGTGPRYCPSIEDKIVRFSDKERHQIFIEPEGYDTEEMYVQGMSTSMPYDVQERMYRSVEGLEKVKIMRYAYAIEYDCIDPQQLDSSLRFREIDGLYTAGQINGSSGYEEAAVQGFMAGANAALWLEGKSPLVLTRADGYIGVLIDDLVTKGTQEPYRMMTSRAEYRLSLRQDNADLRLVPRGAELGLAGEERIRRMENKKRMAAELFEKLETSLSPEKLNPFLAECGESPLKSGAKLREVVKRAGVSLSACASAFGLGEYPREVSDYVETEIKYEGYLLRQNELISKMMKMYDVKLPETLDYASISGLRIEARQKLAKFRPENLFQASNISGVSPADVAVLMVWLKR